MKKLKSETADQFINRIMEEIDASQAALEFYAANS